MHDANNKNDLVLRARKIPKENVDQRNGAEHHAQTKPPDNPAVNTNVDMAHKLSLCLFDAAAATLVTTVQAR